MNRNFLAICLAIVLVSTGTFLASCKKGSSAPASSSAAQLSFGIKTNNLVASLATSNPNNGYLLASIPSPAASVTFTSGIANISGFKLEAKKQGLEIEIKSKSLTHVDLFSLTPALIGASIDTGTYTEIEIRVALAKSSTADLPLVLKGNLTTPAGTTIPFEFDFNDNAEIKAEAHNVVVDSKTDLTSIITLHLNKLLANVTAADIAALTLTNNTIIISSTSNTNIYNIIQDNLSKSGDSDGFERHDRSERVHNN